MLCDRSAGRQLIHALAEPANSADLTTSATRSTSAFVSAEKARRVAFATCAESSSLGCPRRAGDATPIDKIVLHPVRIRDDSLWSVADPVTIEFIGSGRQQDIDR